jgi:hypothetical protein
MIFMKAYGEKEESKESEPYQLTEQLKSAPGTASYLNVGLDGLKIKLKQATSNTTAHQHECDKHRKGQSYGIP